jgi:hypothetical protein
MTRVRVENFTISLDGYGAGPDQCTEHAGSEAATHVILKRKDERDA